MMTGMLSICYDHCCIRVLKLEDASQHWNWSFWIENPRYSHQTCLCSGQADSVAHALSNAREWAIAHGWASMMANSLSATPAHCSL
jgi:hypothetical protein